MTRGRLLALEGLDGSGKSTQCGAIVAALEADGHDVVATREPTDGAWGRRIRAMARSGRTEAPEEELRWFEEDRREHVAQVIAPALAAGRTIVTDRYFLSTVAYQGARGLDWRDILARSEAEFPLPDLVLLFEIEPAAGLARVRARGGRAEPAFERGDFLARVAEIFAAIERPYVARIDGSKSADAVRAAALATLGARWGLGGDAGR
jgi:dTMP kinase